MFPFNQQTSLPPTPTIKTQGGGGSQEAAGGIPWPDDTTVYLDQLLSDLEREGMEDIFKDDSAEYGQTILGRFLTTTAHAGVGSGAGAELLQHLHLGHRRTRGRSEGPAEREVVACHRPPPGQLHHEPWRGGNGPKSSAPLAEAFSSRFSKPFCSLSFVRRSLPVVIASFPRRRAHAQKPRLPCEPGMGGGGGRVVHGGKRRNVIPRSDG